MPQVYAVVHNGRGDFMMAFKNRKGYFFHNSGGGGTIIPAGQFLNGGNNWTLPGGGLDVIPGAIQELEEETGIEMGTGNCTPDAFGAYNAVYFLAAKTFNTTVQEAHDRLEQGHAAVSAIQAGAYKADQYDDLMKAFNCPADNELSDVYSWNLFRDWGMILDLHDNPATDWFYEILKNLRDKLFPASVLDLEGRVVGIGADLVLQPGPEYLVPNILYDETRLLGEGEYILLSGAQRIEHVQFNPATEQGGEGIFTPLQ